MSHVFYELHSSYVFRVVVLRGFTNSRGCPKNNPEPRMEKTKARYIKTLFLGGGDSKLFEDILSRNLNSTKDKG